MAGPANNLWRSAELVTAAALNDTTHGSGTTAERNAISSWPANRPFYDTDEHMWYYNSHASAPSSVTWTRLGSSGEESTGSVSGDATGQRGAGWRMYGPKVTLPTDHLFYLITAIEAAPSNQSVTGRFRVGFDFATGHGLHSNMLTGGFSRIRQFAGSALKADLDSKSAIIGGGTIVLPWILTENSATAYLANSSSNGTARRVTGWESPENVQDAAWSTTPYNRPALKTYYRGFF